MTSRYSTLPASHRDLLERPTFAHLATVRPDGSPQSSVMWFGWDGERARFTLTRTRQKFANLEHEPRVAFSVHEPGNPYRTLEVRGVVESVADDTADAAFYRALQERYDNVYDITDADVRIVVTIRPTKFIAVENGSVVRPE
ncbi:Pyridoxamine 5'-phosphate oxidase-related protein FMN-binding [Nostocoides japonicum T1-X7]|uniref:Pyridoxamine 5'-phosphate oxidase-related protein FMN-binding n=1 Tax=Nostocoides japonicum T1-X7 TaxID=1194083 RepID=A0A077LYH8_9MICO|nr:PPOX class F420-dependent oxidoreductase [Tetrasphaera japonica]CCH77034.1 Pyridoxamine 5'-phosphate oxidase-related protein FMN-binding [Tetrasphaera japonica T1-X7]